jgi:hypothetical protein
MKLSKTIFLVAFALICAFLIISASSIYISASDDLKELDLTFLSLEQKGKNTLEANFVVRVKNSNEIPSSIKILNNTITLTPYSSVYHSICLPVNISKFTKEGWPFSTVIYYTNAVISELLNGVGVTSISRNLSSQIPFLFSNATLSQNGNPNNYSLGFINFIPIVMSTMELAVYFGSKFIGNMTYSGQVGDLISGNISLNGFLNCSKIGSSGSSNLNNLSIEFLGQRWAL